MDSLKIYWDAMGINEIGVRKRRRKDYVQRAILSALAITGTLTIAAVVPNALQILGTLQKNRKFEYQARTVLSRLAEKGHVRFITSRGERKVEITAAGRRTIEIQVQTAAARSSRRIRWDKRWRMIMFDIPEHRNRDRDHLRRIMIEAGLN